MATFTIDLANFAEKAHLNAKTVMKKVTLDCYTRVAMRTPVDTGRARGGWQISGSGMSGGETGALDSTPTGTPNPGWGGADVGNIGEEGAFIFNNVVYIIPLEYGHSKQAPAGMVRLTVAEFDQMIAAAIAGMG